LVLYVLYWVFPVGTKLLPHYDIAQLLRNG
jgi:hypothetical protein